MTEIPVKANSIIEKTDKELSSFLEYVHRIQIGGIENNASDVLLSSGAYPAYQIDGKTVFLKDETKLKSKLLEQYLEVSMEEHDKQALRENLQHDFAITVDGKHRLRVNAFYQNKGLSICFRIITTKTLSFEALNLPDQLEKIIDMQSGLVLVTGAAGSGKSTTLATFVNYINKKYSKHIITVEDPIEYLHENKKSLIEQRDIGTHAKSFSEAIRSSLRQVPDVLLVGELRDLETISLAITAAETGTLVFATLHTNSASSTINRLIDIFPGDKQNQIRAQLSHSLHAVVWQTLLPKKGGKGRIAAFEVLYRNHAIATLIRENKIYQIPSAIETSQAADMMIPIKQMLEYLVDNGEIDTETANQVFKNRI